MDKCETCKLNLFCCSSFRDGCIKSNYKCYSPKDTPVAEEVSKSKHVPKCFIQIVITEETKKAMGIGNSVYVFDRDKFDTKTVNWLGKDFVQVYEKETGEPTLMVDVLAILIIDFNYLPPYVAYCE